MLANGAAAGLSMQQAIGMASRELADPAGAELKRVVDELRRRAVGRGRARQPARPPALARGRGADDARSRSSSAPAATPCARWASSRRRSTPARTCGARSRRCSPASCSRPTSSPAIGGGTILLLNVMSPGVTKRDDELGASGSPGSDRRPRAVDDRVRADPQDDQDRRLMPMPCSSARWPRSSSPSGSPAIPMLRDAGPGRAARRAHRRRARAARAHAR